MSWGGGGMGIGIDGWVAGEWMDEEMERDPVRCS